MSRTLYKPEDLCIYNLPLELLESMSLVYFDGTASVVEPTPQLTEEALAQSLAAMEVANGLEACTACGVKFEGLRLEEKKQHYRSDFHRYNLKRKVHGMPPVSEDAFAVVLETLEESLSGSENSEEDKLEALVRPAAIDEETVAASFANTRSPFVFFKSPKFENPLAVYKACFLEAQMEQPLETLMAWRQKPGRSAVFMIGGGHFAGAIIAHQRRSTKGNTATATNSLVDQLVEVVAQKTFHRYTVRKKQGGSQSASDASRGKATSAGSSIRRQMEVLLAAEVRELLASWKPLLDGCDNIFIRSTGPFNRNVLMGYEGAVLNANDPRMRNFPFTTKRATTTELRKAWVHLTTLGLTLLPKSDAAAKARAKRQEEILTQSKQVKKKDTVELLETEVHTQELCLMVKRSRVPPLVAYLRKHGLSGDFQLQPEEEYALTPTLLHYASAQGLYPVVHALLVAVKSDPRVVNAFGKTPWDVAAGSSRKAFQVARHSLGEGIDWDAAHVGPAKSREQFDLASDAVKAREAQEAAEAMAAARVVSEEEREREAKEMKRKHLLGQGKTIGVLTQVQNMSDLSEDQKKRLMREQRARAAEARMRKQGLNV